MTWDCCLLFAALRMALQGKILLELLSLIPTFGNACRDACSQTIFLAGFDVPPPGGAPGIPLPPGAMPPTAAAASGFSDGPAAATTTTGYSIEFFLGNPASWINQVIYD